MPQDASRPVLDLLASILNAIVSGEGVIVPTPAGDPLDDEAIERVVGPGASVFYAPDDLCRILLETPSGQRFSILCVEHATRPRSPGLPALADALAPLEAEEVEPDFLDADGPMTIDEHGRPDA